MIDGDGQASGRVESPARPVRGTATARSAVRIGLALLAFGGLWTASAPSAAAKRPLPHDSGASGAWHRLLKLSTIASVMHTTAHPDDEHGGVLTWLSRGVGARVSLLSLTRGEAGDNAIGPELFDALGLIRTEELSLAGQYYGLDELYFTSAADYGFSKRLEEALATWGRDAIVRDVVRLIRLERPLVVVSRFQGNERDGHGQHQAAGVITREAFEAAGDPTRFPEQVADGLRPWRPLRLYVGGQREVEPWHVRVDAGRYSPVLGQSFEMFARRGLSLQRSQNGGRLNPATGPAYRYYRRGDAEVATRQDGFFDDLDVGLTGILAIDRQRSSDADRAILVDAARHVGEARERFALDDPTRAVPALRDGLLAIRRARQMFEARPEAQLVLARKEQQVIDAIEACLGVRLEATAVAMTVDSSASSPFAPPPTLPPVVPGQSFHVSARFGHERAEPLDAVAIDLLAPAGWRVESDANRLDRLVRGETAASEFVVTVPADARPTKAPFARGSIAESRYVVEDDALGRPFSPPTLEVRATLSLDGVPIEIRQAVRRWESNHPYGYEQRELTVVPALSVTLAPRYAVVGTAGSRLLRVRTELAVNQPDGMAGEVRLMTPAGWTAGPDRHDFTFTALGERIVVEWAVDPGRAATGEYRLEVVATAAGREFREGHQVIRHRDLEPAALYHPATMTVRVIELEVAPELSVGYVMGIGDEVPAAIAQLGATVELLDDRALATVDLSRFDVIVTGTRAYAARPILSTVRTRMLEYVRAGGHLIVLYNTQELVPTLDAPYPAELPARAEEVSEEDSPIAILARDHPVMQWPNRIVEADFDGWIEQRGSKFWSTWDPRYAAILSTHDIGQTPQQGGWLTAPYGEGHYTYFAYALHRQLPYGVPGAYRLLANVLSLGRHVSP